MEDSEVTMVYSSNTEVLEVHALANLLQEQGIAARVVGDNLQQVFPDTVSSPIELWVPHADAERATALVAGWVSEGAHRQAASLSAWKCPQCGEEVEGSFDICWNCETARPVPA